jgi:hypothetical protein
MTSVQIQDGRIYMCGMSIPYSRTINPFTPAQDGERLETELDLLVAAAKLVERCDRLLVATTRARQEEGHIVDKQDLARRCSLITQARTSLEKRFEQAKSRWALEYNQCCDTSDDDDHESERPE